jgi:hypothetical protein
MSEQTNTILGVTSLPAMVKVPRNDSMVLSFPTHNKRVTPVR